jgi:hypothetical protein
VSLAAVVYIKKSHISVEWLDETLSVHEVTGEAISETFHIPAKAKEAIAYRLGNGKYIEKCRQEIEKAAKARSLAMPILLEEVLGDEVQPGDLVKYTDIPRLKRELKFLERAPKFSEDVRELLFRMNKLVEAAEIHRNPIVFT